MAVKTDYLSAFVLFTLQLFSYTLPAFATSRQEVYITGTVQSFGGYTFSRMMEFDVTKPGPQELGRIVVDGLYNGEYPWVMRIYTDNAQFTGTAGLGHRESSRGLISTDGQFSIPLQISSPNFGPGVWQWIPDLNDPGYRTYRPGPDPADPPFHTDCLLMVVDPRNAFWVAGPDGILFTDDDNLLGDITVKTPFEMTLRANIPEKAVKEIYESFLYLEIIPAP